MTFVRSGGGDEREEAAAGARVGGFGGWARSVGSGEDGGDAAAVEELALEGEGELARLSRDGFELARDGVEPLSIEGHEIHLVDARDDVRDPEQRRDVGMPARLRQHAHRASTRMTATSAVDAPVAMLRVYCTWPGVSAMMNFRVSVAK